MIPPVLLDLGPTRIRLLRRTDEGLEIVEEAETGAFDMAPRLRAAVQAVSGGVLPLPAELILPAEQMLFTDVPAPGAEAGDPDALIAEEMERRTPYPRDEIAIDWVTEGGTARVAAIAIETLDQARWFADALGVEAALFSARPGLTEFPRPPRFSLGTAAQTGERTEPAFTSTRHREEEPAEEEDGAQEPIPAITEDSVEADPEVRVLTGAEITASGVPETGAVERSLTPDANPAPSTPLPADRPEARGAVRLRRIAAALVTALLLGGGAYWLSQNWDTVGPEIAGLIPPTGREVAAIPSTPVTAMVAAPTRPATPAAEGSALASPDLWMTAIDAETRSHDAVALPPPMTLSAAPPPRVTGPPGPLPEAGAETAQIAPIATPDPDQLVSLPDPPAAPDAAPDPDPRVADSAAATAAPIPPGDPAPAFDTLAPTDLATALPDSRPRDRPGDLAARHERARYGGRTLVELAGFRPRARPASPQDMVAKLPPTAQAVLVAPAPLPRPETIALIVATARSSAQPSEAAAASTAAVAVATAPAPTAPPQRSDGQIPTRAEVAREATMEDVLRLNRLNLIGVYGGASDRRALLRLPTGRFVKVQVGDRIDGGRVAAIGEDDLRYTKGGQSITLTIPSG